MMNPTTTLLRSTVTLVPSESGKHYFIDDHRAGEIPLDLLRQHLHALRHAERQSLDQARLVACLAGDGNLLSCVVEAPDPAAVLRWHTLQGLPCGEIRPTDWARRSPQTGHRAPAGHSSRPVQPRRPLRLLFGQTPPSRSEPSGIAGFDHLRSTDSSRPEPDPTQG